MAVSQDQYELPVAVADSERELEHMLNLRKGTVASHISFFKSGRVKRQKYFRIEINDEEDMA